MPPSLSTKRSLLWLATVGCLALVLALAALMLWTRPQAASLPADTSTGEALIGGPFTLVDQTGQSRTEQDFVGRYALIYFGYTYCPDVCPTELGRMKAALSALPDAQRAKIQPVFISVDPERDTVAALASYVDLFDMGLIGLTGSEEQVRVAKRAYRVYSAKQEREDSSDYLVDHSSFIYLMDTKGKFVQHFGISDPVSKITTTLASLS